MLTVRGSASKIFESEKGEVQKAGEIRKYGFIICTVHPIFFYDSTAPTSVFLNLCETAVR
jgi:hypothetical protein